MRRKTVWIGALGVLAIAIASAVAIPSFGDGGTQNIQIIRNPPEGSGCICPQIWDPVECKDAQGNHYYFSNSCVAGCHGQTHCGPLDGGHL